ncbi:helix-turn-helix transcriptional regulator [Sphingobium sp.]|uniref:helix-turn-helix transcriptional regulator n=1 Tax=Sphingobium sp. TaxID=1912891 RepID=UPI003BB63EAC
MQPTEMRDIRKAAGLTQEQLADAIGVSRVLIGQMERGNAPIEKRTELAIRYVVDQAGNGD